MSSTTLDQNPAVIEEGANPIDSDLVDVRTEYKLVKAHSYVAIFGLIISALFGTVVAIKFIWPGFLGSQAWATWGLLRYNHTQGILFAWLCNAFMAFFYHAVPRLAGRPIFSPRLGWFLFYFWNIGTVLTGWGLVEANLDAWWLAIKPLEWTEFPPIVNVMTEIGLLLMVIQFGTPLIRGPERSRLYVSAWYILGGVVFTMLSFPMGSFIPYFLPGTMGAAFSGLWIHDAVGLLVTPLALAISYYVLPAATGRPVHSHFISMIGFWVLFFAYPLNGTHHYVYSSIPMDMQRAAIAASVIVGLDVILVVFNQLMSVRHNAWRMRRDVPLRYVFAGVIFYLIVSIQGAVQALMPVQRLTHFSDWVIGHSHMAMFGFGSFIAMGGVLHAWQRMPGARYNARWANWSFWLIFGGLVAMIVDLTIAGLMQGIMWQGSQQWMASVLASMPFWAIRALTAAPIIIGFGFFIAAMISGPTLEQRNSSAGSAS